VIGKENEPIRAQQPSCDRPKTRGVRSISSWQVNAGSVGCTLKLW